MRKNDNEKIMSDFMTSEKNPCPVCLGKGKINNEICSRCKGTGQVSKYSKITYV